jgi:hypothetical protein
MAITKLRGSTQIRENTIDISKLVSDFLGGTDWNITNGNNDATITGIKDPVNDKDAVNKESLDGLVDRIITATFTLEDIVINGTEEASTYFTGDALELPITDDDGNLIIAD